MAAIVICFGEVLWDVFPDGEKIGGAPLNVALRLNSMGINTSIASKIGNDQLGKRLLEFVDQQGLKKDLIQIDTKHETGQVIVQLDEKGSATYTIAHPAAWDKIEFSPSILKQVKQCEAFLFGSLVARDEVSRATLNHLLNEAKYKVFDVNLRAPHYSIPLLEALMNTADFIKFNDDELAEITQALNHNEEEIEQQIRFIAEHTQTKTICVTTGSDGALLPGWKTTPNPVSPSKERHCWSRRFIFSYFTRRSLQQKPAKEAWKELVQWVMVYITGCKS